MRPDLFLSKLFSLVEATEEDVIYNFIGNLDDHNKILFLICFMKLHIQCCMNESVFRSFAVSVHNLIRTRKRFVAHCTIVSNRSFFSFHAVASTRVNE